MEEICAERSIPYLPAPAPMVDADGFLARPGWSDDPTHAGPAYGHAVLDQLSAWCAAPSPGLRPTRSTRFPNTPASG